MTPVLRAVPAGGVRYLRGLCAAVCLAVAFGSLASGAAAAPGNDDFANRYTIPSTLPAEVEGSNVGATDEPGDSINIFGAGRTVWWEWVAPESSLVSIETCGTEFGNFVGVFDGAEEVSELQERRVVPTPNLSGPGCDKSLVFPAEAGTGYQIGLDGSQSLGFLEPDGEVVGLKPTEGPIKLQIKPVPYSSNDAFGDALPLEGYVWGDNGERHYIAETSGYNWGTGLEPGEPAHAGPGTGASVWYRWTAPETGTAYLELNSDAPWGEGPEAVAYSGDSVTSLTPRASDGVLEINLLPVSPFEVEAGHEYRIAVAGAPRTDGEPWQGTFWLSVQQNLAREAPPSPQASQRPEASHADAASSSVPAAARLPRPTIVHRSVDAKARKASFRLRSSVVGVGFRCKLDKGSFERCSSRYVIHGLELGRHRIEVVATKRGGAVSPPATMKFALSPR